jgi:arylsulfatase A-like enzyme
MQILILVVVGLVCLVGWAISSIQEAFRRAKDSKDRNAMKKARLRKIKQKWGNRKIDIDKTLEARNENIIEEHLGRLVGCRLGIIRLSKTASEIVYKTLPKRKVTYLLLQITITFHPKLWTSFGLAVLTLSVASGLVTFTLSLASAPGFHVGRGRERMSAIRVVGADEVGTSMAVTNELTGDVQRHAMSVPIGNNCSAQLSNAEITEPPRQTSTQQVSLGSPSYATAFGQSKRRPNVVLIVADDLGYRDLGCFGAPVVQTPNLDRMASEGIRFTNFVVSWPACTPSRGSILTGRYPQRNGLYELIRNNEVDCKFQFDEKSYAVSLEMTLGLDLREITIAQALSGAGYATGIVGKWDSGRARRFLPTQRGFDFFYGFANTGIDYYRHDRYGIPSLFRGNDRIQESGHATDLFQREAIRFIREHYARPFFLYVAFNAPHIASTFDKSARQVPEEFLKMYSGLVGPQDRRGGMRTDEYMALITQMDSAIGSILREIEAHGITDKTLVLFTSDNGGGDTGPLRGRKATLFEGGIRVPLIARWPGRIQSGKVSNEFTSTLEFYPSLLAAAGIARPSTRVLDGFNFLPVLQGTAKTQRNEFFWEYSKGRAARVGQWKWIESDEGSGLFDLLNDIGETRDLSADRHGILKDLQQRWVAWKKEMDESQPRGPFRDY